MLFVARTEEEKVRAAHEDISVLMKRSGAEMRYYIEASTNKLRVGFTEAVNTAVEEDVVKVRVELELRRRRDTEEAARVTEDDDCRKRYQEEEGTYSSV